MATRTISALGGNWDDVAAWTEAAVPTAADDVVATALSGNLTLNVNSACRSFNMTNYVATFTMSGNNGLSIGDGTAGAGNVALKLVSGMTFSLGGANAFTFASTSATQQTIDSGGKTLPELYFPSPGGSYIFSSDITSSADITIEAGSLDFGNHAVTITYFLAYTTGTKSLTLGSSTIICSASGNAWRITTATGLTFSGGTSTIRLTSSSDNNFIGAGQTYSAVEISATSSGTCTFSNDNTFTKLARSGTGTKTIKFTAGSTTTLTGGTDAFFSGSSGNVWTIESTSAGSAATLSKSSGTVDSSFLSLKDSAATGGATFNAVDSTDVSGNSGWIFAGGTFTATSAVSAGAATVSASAEFDQPTYTGAAGAAGGASTLAASATFTPGTDMGTSALTVGASTGSAAATFTKPVYAGSSALTVGAASLASSATFDKPTYTGSASATVGAAFLASSATYVKPEFSGSVALTVGLSALSGSAQFVKPVYAASVLAAAGAATLSAVATYRSSSVGTAQLFVGAAVLGASVQSAPHAGGGGRGGGIYISGSHSGQVFGSASFIGQVAS